MNRSYLLALSLCLGVSLLSACGDDDTRPDGAIPDGGTMDLGMDMTVGEDLGTTPDADPTMDADVVPDASVPDVFVPPSDPPTVVGGNRPTEVRVPNGYDPATPTPLVLLLHGRGASDEAINYYFNAVNVARDNGFFLLSPNAQGDPSAWSPQGADFDFLVGIVNEMKAGYNIDPNKIFVLGFSSGGSMAHRLACDAADQFSAVTILSGWDYLDPSRCQPTMPVSVLHIHGTADFAVNINGAAGQYPSTADATLAWANRTGCDTSMPSISMIDIDQSIPGNETDVTAYDQGCPSQHQAAFWAVNGGGHPPAGNPEFLMQNFAWWDAHSR